MKEPTRNLLVGLFVLTSLAMLAILMVWFGEAPSWLGGSEWTLRITGTRNLSGISEGSPVRLNGIEIGRVKALEFHDPKRPDQGVEIVAMIKNKYSVPRGATAKIFGATLGFGKGHVAIEVEGAGTGPLPKKNAQIFGKMHSMLGELINKDLFDELTRTINHIGNLTAEWTPVGTNLAGLLEKRTLDQVGQPGAEQRGAVPNFSTVVQRLDALLANINGVLGDGNVQEEVKASISDIKSATEALRDTVVLWKTESQRISDNVNEGIDNTEADLSRVLSRTTVVLEHLEDASKSIAQTMDGVAAGQGTAGLLVRDDRLYEAAVLSLERLADAIGSLQRIFGKIEDDGYITLAKAPLGFPRVKVPVGTHASDLPTE